MTQSQYLTEENYKKANKKLKMISLVIFMLGVLVGGTLITFGAIKSAETEKINDERAVAAKDRLDKIKTEKSALEAEYKAKQQECDSLSMGTSDWFEKANQCTREASSIQSKINDLEMEQLRLEDTDHTVRYTSEKSIKSTLLYVLGAFTIGVSAMISLSIFLITKRRALIAYNMQSVMPVGKEAVESYTPTAAKAAGEIAGSVAEGITRGIKKGKNS